MPEIKGLRATPEYGPETPKGDHRPSDHRPSGGDQAWLAAKVRKCLDRAGLEQVKIVVSNLLDEHVIRSLQDQGAPIDLEGYRMMRLRLDEREVGFIRSKDIL